jgi:hypothetical protein
MVERRRVRVKGNDLLYDPKVTAGGGGSALPHVLQHISVWQRSLVSLALTFCQPASAAVNSVLKQWQHMTGNCCDRSQAAAGPCC